MISYSIRDDVSYENQPFEMDEDYGFYEELEYQAEQSSSNDECYMAQVLVDDGDAASLLSSPPIISSKEVACISEYLPWSLGDCRWNRLFATSRDGASFPTFMRRVRSHGQTVIVARTTDGRVVGGFASEMWSGRRMIRPCYAREKREQPSAAEGADLSFLFVIDTANKTQPNTIATRAFIPGYEMFGSSPTSTLDYFDTLSLEDDQQVEIMKPSKNSSGLKQVCQFSTENISLVGDDLCLSINGNFSTGVICMRGNACEDFEVTEFEVYSLLDE